MKKTRRIEITAFRRTVTRSVAEPTAEPGKEPPQSQDTDDTLAQLNQADLVDAVLSSIDDESPAELEHLIDGAASKQENSKRNRSG